MAEIRKPYAITNHVGEIEYIGLHTSEDDCWRIFLGWPTVGEVKDAQARGLSCCPVIATREPTDEQVAELEALRRGEFICQRCGLRKDAERLGQIPF